MCERRLKQSDAGDNDSNSHKNQNNALEMELNNDMDIFLQSESPETQKILLLHRLQEDLDRNAAGQVRYVDSDIYLKGAASRSPSIRAERQMQDTTLAFPSSQSQPQGDGQQMSKQSQTTMRNGKTSSNVKSFLRRAEIPTRDGPDDLMLGRPSSGQAHQSSSAVNETADCQVCFIKKVRETLVKETKRIQESNEELSRLFQLSSRHRNSR